MPEPTVDQVLNASSASTIRKPSGLAATVAFFLFPPLGVYLFWKVKTFHQLFAILTAFLGLLNVLMAASFYFSYPQMVDLGRQLNYSVAPNVDKLALILLFFSLFQTVSCLVLAAEAKKMGYLNTVRLLYLVVMLLVDFIVIPLLLGAAVFDFFQGYLQQYQNQINSSGLGSGSHY